MVRKRTKRDIAGKLVTMGANTERDAEIAKKRGKYGLSL